MRHRNGASSPQRDDTAGAQDGSTSGKFARSSRKQNQPQAARVCRASNGPPRSLEAIGAELRKLRNIFDSGEFLVEAREACEHGEWGDWLDTYFDASSDTAENHMAAYRLSLKFRTVRNLALPPVIIYELGEDIDAPVLPAIIKALDKASKSAAKPLSVADCKRVITVTLARESWGNDLPEATLIALDESVDQDVEWAAGAINELKRAQPDTAEAAAKVVLAQHRKHLEARFGGALPDWLDGDMLDRLDCVDPKFSKRLLTKLQAAAQPLDWYGVSNIVHDVKGQDDDAEDAPTPEQADEQNDADDEVPSPPEGIDAELLEALLVIVHHARRPLPTSVDGIKSVDLVEAARFLDKLHEIATSGSVAKRAADRAEARSRAGRSA